MAHELDSLIEKPACRPDLHGRVALVTGGRTGMGRAVAVRDGADCGPAAQLAPAESFA